MSLLDEYMTKCNKLVKASIPDGLSGYKYVWETGAEFLAAIVKEQSAQATIAEKADVTEQYSVVVYKGESLMFHDVFQRVSDGAVFRVTSNVTDSETPERATFQIGRVTAERWVIPS